jgi:hypothetical protein
LSGAAGLLGRCPARPRGDGGTSASLSFHPHLSGGTKEAGGAWRESAGRRAASARSARRGGTRTARPVCASGATTATFGRNGPQRVPSGKATIFPAAWRSMTIPFLSPTTRGPDGWWKEEQGSQSRPATWVIPPRYVLDPHGSYAPGSGWHARHGRHGAPTRWWVLVGARAPTASAAGQNSHPLLPGEDASPHFVVELAALIGPDRSPCAGRCSRGATNSSGGAAPARGAVPSGGSWGDRGSSMTW